MPTIDLVVETRISASVRAAQVSSMFDVPPEQKSRLTWRGELPIEDRDWNVGLIVGPSGCGKSTILRDVFGATRELSWQGQSVVDDFPADLGVDALAAVCQAVGFNTIPAWLRPYSVLSNGEKFRVEIARRLVEDGPTVVMDEFTSVVDRQVAHIASHAVQKYVRKRGVRFVAATCHYDLEEWLQPDWILEPATMTFRWRSVQRRPAIDCCIARVPYSQWREFAPFHYLTAELHRAARCFALSIGGRPAAFAAVLYRPHDKVRDIYGMSRLVTLPDFQGLGLAFALCDRLGAAYKALGRRYRAYPAHPPLVRSFDRSSVWALVKRPDFGSTNRGSAGDVGRMGGRPCAVFEYCGPAMDRDQAALLVG